MRSARPIALLVVCVVVCACSFSGAPGNPSGSDAGSLDASVDAEVTEPNARRRLITISPPPIAGGSVVDMPIPVRMPIGDPDYIEHGNIDGLDLFFRAEDGTRLDHDIERLIVVNGELIAWVVLPVLPASGTSIELFYGKGNLAPSGGNPWIGLADLVFHFETDVGRLTDHSPSETHPNLPIDGVETTPGIFGDALDVTGALIALPDGAAIDRALDSFALSLWFHQDVALGIADLVFYKGGNSSPGYQFAFGTVNWNGNVNAVGAASQRNIFGTEPILGPLGFNHLALVVDRATNLMTAYTNGVAQPSVDIPVDFGSVSDIGQPASIGLQGFEVDGDFDELRAYPRSLTADWIAADHAFGLDQGLVTVGDAEAAVYPSE